MFARDYEQTRISRGSLEPVTKHLEKYEKFETYGSRHGNDKKTSDKDRRTRTKIQRHSI